MNKILATISLALLYGACAQSQPNKDITVPPPSIDVSKYDWLHTRYNMVQFYDKAALEHFYNNWQTTHVKKLSVVLLGDSHLQTGHYPEQFARRMRELHGDGGFGLVFPNSTVETYSPVGYKSTHTGTWERQRSFVVNPKLPMGVRGMTCRTTKLPAGFDISFADDIPSEYTNLKIYCKKADSSYDVELNVNGQKILVPIDASTPDLPYIETKIPLPADKKISLNVVKKNSGESEFEFYGMSLETPHDKGAIVHNAGVGAAMYRSVLYQWKFKEQLPHFAPNLVIIDFGTNDYLYDDIIKPELEKEIRKVIATVREGAPDASIVLTTVQDLYWKDVNCKSGTAFSELIHRIAADTKCGVYDWFWVSGGLRTLKQWNAAGLAQKDMIHLTASGYRLKGNLLFDALKNTVDYMSQNPDEKQLLLNMDSLKASVPNSTTRSATTTTTTTTTSTSTSKTTTTPSSSSNTNTDGKKATKYTVQSGDTLGAIARKNGVTVAQLVEWNKLESPDKIYTGDVILIYK